jgi:ATP-binding cassette, subfamily B, bacterial
MTTTAHGQEARSQGARAVLATLGRVPPILRAAAPGWSVAAVALLLVDVAAGLTVLGIVRELVDAVTSARPTAEVLRWVAFAGGATVLAALARALARLAREAQAAHVEDHVTALIQDRAVAADLAFYESPAYHDTLLRARRAGPQRPAQVVANLVLAVRNAVLLFAALAIVATIDAIVVPVLGLIVLPALVVRLRSVRTLHDWQQRRTQLERRAGYLDWLVTSDTHAKELRINRLGQVLRGQHDTTRGLIRTERLRIARRRTATETAVEVLAAIAFFGALAHLVRGTATGATSVGDLVLFLLVFQRAQAAGQELVGQLSRLYEDHLYLGLLFAFLDLRDEVVRPDDPLPTPRRVHDAIRLEQVSFRYPDTDAWVLRDVDLTLRPGEVVALVGENGSGKTSLVKLLCRLYDPTEGRLTVDGVDLRVSDPDEHGRLVSVIFQDHLHYADTVAENIRYGDVELPVWAAPDGTPEIRRAGRDAGADDFVGRLGDGYLTRLTRLFDDGVELSVGQWQRLALARALVRPAPLLVLDEPSSALDPDAEHALFRDLRDVLGGRSALIISHRMSSIRGADTIHVLHEGRIVESGSHEQLMALDGRYRATFEVQATAFRTVGA